MREIRFRAWLKNTELSKLKQRMYYNCGVSFSDCGMSVELERPMIVVGGWHPTHPANFFELMQFTGLYDKNGKEIYEGDMVTKDGKVGCEVIFRDGQFCVKVLVPVNAIPGYGFIGRIEKFWAPLDSECEVIGNIYENPELLIPSNK